MIRACAYRPHIVGWILLLLLASAGTGRAQTALQRVTVDELKTALANRQAVIVDVRDPRDWESSDQKIEGAIRLDPRNLDPTNLPIAKNATVVLY